MSEYERATLAGGCFWCVEAVFEELRGVVEVTSGYAGGHVENPSYEAVCEGDTGHAEVIEVVYDPAEISLEQLLGVFFTVHDPTTLNRQGPDVGSQYRSAIFYEDDEQREVVESFIEELEDEGVYEDEVVTEVERRETFYEAEPYHQDYFEKNPGSTYCQVNTQPKLRKVRETYGDLLRE